MGVERGSAAGSAGPEAIPQPTGRVARIFFRHLNKLSEEVLCAVGSERASRLRISGVIGAFVSPVSGGESYRVGEDNA